MGTSDLTNLVFKFSTVPKIVFFSVAKVIVWLAFGWVDWVGLVDTAFWADCVDLTTVVSPASLVACTGLVAFVDCVALLLLLALVSVVFADFCLVQNPYIVFS